MKNIEIITTQNVVLQYELASLQDRILAFILDMICIVFTISVLSPVIGLLSVFSTVMVQVALFIVVVAFMFYSLAFEMFNNGQSIGKLIMKIRVIRLVGGRATFSDYAARWVFRLIDIYFSLGGIASILVLSSPKAQRIGDIVANTVVIKTALKTNINLQDILAIHQSNKYTPRYQQARKLQEQDALLIKSTLDRYRKFRNDAHQEAVILLSTKIQEMLGIDQVAEQHHHTFLQTVLQDYVVLSR